jgi:hypothetical protein
MYVIAKHEIYDPGRFWSTIIEAAPNMPTDLRMIQILPSSDGAYGVCLWEARSVDAVRSIVDAAVGHTSRNEYFAVDSRRAIGLPG